MSRFNDRRIPMAGSVWHEAMTDLYLTVVAPTWPWGTLRLAGLALLAEAAFLFLVVASSVPISGLATLSLLVGEATFVASFAGGTRSN